MTTKTLQEIANQLNSEGYLGITDWKISPEEVKFKGYHLEDKFLVSASGVVFKTLPGSEDFFTKLTKHCPNPPIISVILYQYPQLWYPWYSPYIAEFKVQIQGEENGEYIIHRLPEGEVTFFRYDGVAPGYLWRGRRGRQRPWTNGCHVSASRLVLGKSSEGVPVSWSEVESHIPEGGLKFPS